MCAASRRPESKPRHSCRAQSWRESDGSVNFPRRVTTHFKISNYTRDKFLLFLSSIPSGPIEGQADSMSRTPCRMQQWRETGGSLALPRKETAQFRESDCAETICCFLLLPTYLVLSRLLRPCCYEIIVLLTSFSNINVHVSMMLSLLPAGLRTRICSLNR